MDNFKRSLGFDTNLNDTEYMRGTYEEPERDFITPEPLFYNIVLIKPTLIDDIDYVYDQIIEENNPVILDLSLFENTGDNFIQLSQKLKTLREAYNAEAIVLCNNKNKHLILVTPSKIKIKIKD